MKIYKYIGMITHTNCHAPPATFLYELLQNHIPTHVRLMDIYKNWMSIDRSRL